MFSFRRLLCLCLFIFFLRFRRTESQCSVSDVLDVSDVLGVSDVCARSRWPLAVQATGCILPRCSSSWRTLPPFSSRRPSDEFHEVTLSACVRVRVLGGAVGKEKRHGVGMNELSVGMRQVAVPSIVAAPVPISRARALMAAMGVPDAGPPLMDRCTRMPAIVICVMALSGRLRFYLDRSV